MDIIKSQKCLICGENITDSDSKYMCNLCADKISFIKQLERIDKAQEKIKNCREKYYSGLEWYDYLDEAAKVKKKLLHGEKFDSIEEVCVAIECEKEGIKYLPNYKIGKYRVDFMFPELKTVLEVDGDLYHSNNNREEIREYCLSHILGCEYEIIHIRASFIPRLIILNLEDAIDFTIRNRKMDRRKTDKIWDTQYFEKYVHLEGFLRGRKK